MTACGMSAPGLREAEPDVTNWDSAQVRGESECYPQPPTKEVT